MHQARIWARSIKIALLTAAIGVSVFASALDVAIVAAANASSTHATFTDPQAKLMGTGLFDSVDIINAASGTPTLAQLQAYDAVIVWSNTNFNNSALLGDTLADYVDQGGGVVISTFANSTTTANRYLTGRWLTGDYQVIMQQGGNTSGLATLGTVLDPGHPIMQGVSTFSGGTSGFRPTTTNVAAGATKIALWSDGRTLVAVGSNPQRVDLGFYPPSSDVTSTWWVSSTDGARLMANALVFAAGVDQATVSGTVTLQGLATNMSGYTLNVEIRNPGSTIPLESSSTTLGPLGEFSIDTSLPAGTYDVSVKASHWLRSTTSSVSFSSTGVSGLTYSLINGDVNQNNEVDLPDYTQLAAAFGSIDGDPNWNPNADLNGDGEVALGDYNILANNFGQIGDD